MGRRSVPIVAVLLLLAGVLVSVFPYISQLIYQFQVDRMMKEYDEGMEVVETAAISPTDIEKILIQEGRDLVTLMTCHPQGHDYQRYLVYCERVE